MSQRQATRSALGQRPETWSVGRQTDTLVRLLQREGNVDELAEELGVPAQRLWGWPRGLLDRTFNRRTVLEHDGRFFFFPTYYGFAPPEQETFLRTLIQHDFVAGDDDNDLDLITISRTPLAQPQHFRVPFARTPSTVIGGGEADIWLVPEDLGVSQTAALQCFYAPAMFQPMAMIVLMSGLPVTARAHELRDRLAREITPREIGQFYLGVALLELGTDQPFAALEAAGFRFEIFCGHYRLICDLFPRAHHALTRGEFTAGRSIEELVDAAGVREWAELVWDTLRTGWELDSEELARRHEVLCGARRELTERWVTDDVRACHAEIRRRTRHGAAGGAHG